MNIPDQDSISPFDQLNESSIRFNGPVSMTVSNSEGATMLVHEATAEFKLIELRRDGAYPHPTPTVKFPAPSTFYLTMQAKLEGMEGTGEVIRIHTQDEPTITLTNDPESLGEEIARRLQLPTADELIDAERRRQVEELHYTAGHDDEHGWDSLLDAARCYLRNTDALWPFHPDSFKRTNRVRDLIKAGALGKAALEAFDRDTRNPNPANREQITITLDRAIRKLDDILVGVRQLIEDRA